LQLVNGDPDGLRIVSIAGRTTVLAAVPITEMNQLLARHEADRVAVYFLTGISMPPREPTNVADGFVAKPVIYIGQTGSVRRRFAEHHRMQDADWSSLFVATTTCGVFNSAHARFVEKVLTERAREVGACEVLNQADSVHLDDGDRAFAEEFGQNVFALSQILGSDHFRPRPTVGGAAPSAAGPTSVQNLTSPTTILKQQVQDFKFQYTNKNPINATMRVIGGRFILLKNSEALRRDSINVASVAFARQRAIDDGYISQAETGEFHTVLKDMEFGSPSAAGQMVYGSSCRGPEAWFVAGETRTYADWLNGKAVQPAGPVQPALPLASDQVGSSDGC